MPILQGLFGSDTKKDNLRIIITRHGERTDLALGPNWVSRARRNGGRGGDPRISYLSPRADFSEWNFDPPLTVNGERQSRSIGSKLLHLGYPIDYCYSSPSYRTVQTASKILEGQGRQAIPINIEPGLFECPSWYAGAPINFIPPEYLSMDPHFNINPDYSPLYNTVDPSENERGYYQRSRELIDMIIKTHKNQGGTVLLSGHAASIEALANGMRRSRGETIRLQNQANKVNYSNFAILERDARTKQWIVHSPRSFENPYGGQGTIQSSIPLYSVTSQYLPTIRRRHHPPGDRSRHHRYH